MDTRLRLLVVVAAFLLGGLIIHQTPFGAKPLAAQTAGLPAPTTLIARIWHGHTPAAKAEEYTKYIYEAGIKKIESIPGNRGVQLFRRIDDKYGDFTVISYWDSIEAIKRFAGEKYEETHNLPKDPEFLVDMEPTVKHLTVLVNEWPK
jgi:heme-degrading monooxygenase HmoA